MEVVPVQGLPGKYDVYLQGKVYDCMQDIDCPGAAICAQNQTWQAENTIGMCMCNTWNGFQGATCEETCIQARVLLGLNLAAIWVSFIVGVYALYLLGTLVHARTSLGVARKLYDRRSPRSRSSVSRPRGESLVPKFHINPIMVTLFFLVLGQVLLCAGSILSAMATTGFVRYYQNTTDSVTGETVKRVPQELDNARSVSSALGSCLCMCAVVLLPLTWLDLLIKAHRLRKTNASVVIGLSVLSVLIIMGILLPLYMLVAQDYRDGTDTPYPLAIYLVWGFVFGSCAVLSAMVLLRADLLLRERTGNELVLREDSLRRFFQRVRAAACLLVLMNTAAFLAYCVLGPVFPRRTYYTTPFCVADPNSIVFRCGAILIALQGAVCVLFLHRSVLKTDRAALHEKLRFREDPTCVHADSFMGNEPNKGFMSRRPNDQHERGEKSLNPKEEFATNVDHDLTPPIDRQTSTDQDSHQHADAGTGEQSAQTDLPHSRHGHLGLSPTSSVRMSRSPVKVQPSPVPTIPLSSLRLSNASVEMSQSSTLPVRSGSLSPCDGEDVFGDPAFWGHNSEPSEQVAHQGKMETGPSDKHLTMS